jgi:hypothetical protein
MKNQLLKSALLFVFITFFTFGTSRADLLIYYPFDVESGTVVDNQGTQGSGVLVGGSTFVEGVAGNAWQGNRAGANDAYIQTGLTGTALGMGPDSVYTAMAWVKWDGSSGNVDHMVFGQEDGPGNAAMLHHGIRDDSESNAHYGGWGNDLGDAGVVPVGDWTHLTFQFDGVDKVVFVNGVETARGAGSTMQGHAMDVIVGGHGRDAADPAGNSFNGAIDEVKIYDEVLTALQIMEALVASPDTGDDNENGGAGDGMDDGWELANNLDPTVDDSAEDPDDDGLTNLEEWNGGETPTNPREADSDGDDLNDGEEVNTHGTNPNNADSDADGLNDGDEIAANTEPLDADTDGDEMGDGYEVDNGHDPLLAADAAEDADDDGSLNLEEYTRGTDPNKQDTDVDGIFDGAETGTGTFVSASDTGTDPLNPDTDSDGLNDGDELAAGADPFDPDTDGDTVPDGLDDDPLSSGEGIGFGLVSYWPLDADLMDAVDDNHGTEEGGVIPFEAGKFNNAINLDGTQNVIITGGDESEFDFTGGSMTVSAWCTAATIDLGWQCLIAKGEGNGWRMHRRGGDVPEEFAWTGGVGDTPAHGTPIVIGGDPETWHHVVGVTDGATQIESLYIDGVEVATKTGAVLEDRGNRMRIGDNPDALGRGWNGKIDDVAIWARALPADTIAEIWADGDGTSIEVLLGGGGLGLAITDISVTTNGDVSLTWNSRSSLGTTYAVFSTDDLSLPLEDWSEIDDGVDTGGDSTTFVIPSAFLADEDKLFFFVRKN